MSAAADRFPPRDTAAYGRILASAEACFGNLGFQKASVVEIAAAAQVSKPLVYRYFESKEHLYERVISSLVQTWNDVVVAELSTAETRGVAEALRAMHGQSLAFARRRPLLRGLLAQESRLLLATYSDLVERTLHTLKAQIEECLRTGTRAGEVRHDLSIDAMAEAVTEIHVAFVERVVSGTEKPGAERVALDAFECLLFGVCPAPEDAKPSPKPRRKRSR